MQRSILIKSPIGGRLSSQTNISKRMASPIDDSDVSEYNRKNNNRDSVSFRRNIVLSRNQVTAQQVNIRQSIAFGGKSQITGSQLGGVFLEFNPKKYVTNSLKEQDIVQLKQVFDYYDSEDAGMLSPNDLKQMLQNNGYQPTRETLYEIFAEMDEEEVGGVTFEYFIQLISPDRQSSEKKDTIRRVYRKWDKMNKGYMVYDDIKQIVCNEMMENIDQDMLKEVNHPFELFKIFDKMDSNMDGKVSFEDFYNVMTKKVYF